MRILSVDLGDVRTGLALSDQSEMLASPLCVITEYNRDKLLNQICDIIKKHNVQLIVVGHPKNMDGTRGASAQKCADFAKLLQEHSNIKTVLWDERCTTMSAHVFMNSTDTRGKKRKNNIDAAAASIILQDYLDFRRNTL